VPLSPSSAIWYRTLLLLLAEDKIRYHVIQSDSPRGSKDHFVTVSRRPYSPALHSHGIRRRRTPSFETTLNAQFTPARQTRQNSPVCVVSGRRCELGIIAQCAHNVVSRLGAPWRRIPMRMQRRTVRTTRHRDDVVLAAPRRVTLNHVVRDFIFSQ